MLVIKTRRLLLRPVVSDDWQSIKKIWEDFNKSEYSQYDMPHDTEDGHVQKRIAKWEKAGTGTEHMFFAVCLDGRVIGYTAFNKRERGYEAGYCFHSEYSGKGYARESHIAVFDYLRSLGIKEITARTALKNLPSVRFLKSLGFALTGTEKVSFYKDASSNDIVFDGGIFKLDL